MLLLGLFLPTVYLRLSEPTSARQVEVETEVHGDLELRDDPNAPNLGLQLNAPMWFRAFRV